MKPLAPNCRCYVDMAEVVLHSISSSLGVPSLMPGEYRNPFSFTDEFDQWFEFEKRRHCDCEPTFHIIRDMLSDDLHRAAQSLDTNYSSLKATANAHYGRMPPLTRALIGRTS